MPNVRIICYLMVGIPSFCGLAKKEIGRTTTVYTTGLFRRCGVVVISAAEKYFLCRKSIFKINGKVSRE